MPPSLLPSNADERRIFFRSLRRWVVIAFYVGCVAVVLVVVVSIAMFALGFGSASAKPNPPDDFKHFTGWTLPSDARILRAENTFGGFNGDGDYTLIVKTSTDRVETWAAASDSGTWKNCPIPSEIREACLNLPKHNGRLYRAIKVADSDNDWHRGSLVIVNSETGMVWVYAWKK